MSLDSERSTLLKQLRSEIASAISSHSANDVPAICVGIGLGPGNREESFQSKFKYADRRLREKRAAEYPELAARLLELHETYALREALAKVEELGRPTLSELTRRRIIALFDKGPVSSELDLMAVLKRIWPVDEIPSRHPAFRSSSLEFEITQAMNLARITAYDGGHQQVLESCGLLTCSHSQLVRFLELISSPLVQSRERQAEIVQAVNQQLAHDGFQLAVVRQMSGSPVYEVQTVGPGSPSDASISSALAAFDPGTVSLRWTQALDRRETDPEGAITLARTLLEDVCKWIIVEANKSYDEKDDLPVLYRKLADVLNLAPDAHTEKIFKQILGSCQSVVEALGSMRNKIGDAHSPGPKRVKPAKRHAELAVNLSGAMATFLVSTWSFKKETEAA